MLVTRMRQVVDLLRPTARAISWYPPLWAAALASGYVLLEARSGYIGYRMTVLRLGALLLCMGAAFVLDDVTEDTIGHVPTPLLMRRALRISLLLPVLAAAWAAMLYLAGDVGAQDGGPMPVGDLTLEATTLFAVALCAACLGARFTSDRLGGTVAAPILLVLAAAAMLLPDNQRMLLGSPDLARWEDAHDWWRAMLVLAVLIFVWLNRSSGSHPRLTRLREAGRTPRAV